MTHQFDLNLTYARSLTYSENGRVNNGPLSTALTKGVSGIVDFFVAKHAENSLGDLVEKYGLDFKIEPYLDRKITFSSSVDGKKTATALREKVVVPKYVEDIILCGQILADNPPGKFRIFSVGDDQNINLKGNITQLARELRIPVKYLLERWNFDYFQAGRQIQEKLKQALTVSRADPFLSKVSVGRRIDYDIEVADEAYRMMNNHGIVKNLFGDDVWRTTAMQYGIALLEEVVRVIDKEKSRGVEAKKEFIEKVYLLFTHFRDKIIQQPL